jgi:hypothetical protein
MLAVQMPLRAAQAHRVQPDGIGQRLNPARPAAVRACHCYRDLARSEVEGHPALTDRVPPGRAPITDQLHAGGVAAVDHRAHHPRRQHLAGRYQRLNLGEFGPLLATATTRRSRRSDRDDEPRTPLQSHQPACRIGFRAQRTVTVLGRQRMQTTSGVFEPRPAPLTEVSLLDGVKRPRTQVLSLLRRQMLAHP